MQKERGAGKDGEFLPDFQAESAFAGSIWEDRLGVALIRPACLRYGQNEWFW